MQPNGTFNPQHREASELADQQTSSTNTKNNLSISKKNSKFAI
jgi:hypothetical protein